jgi:electron transfer flavoprotein beta subunit
MGGVDAMLFGKQAIDGDTGLVPGMVARKLGWPALTYAAAIPEVDPAGKTIKLVRLLEEGRQVVTSRLPAVISVVKEINEPRYPSFMGIRKASRATIPAWSAADLGLDPGTVGAAGSSVAWAEIYSPPAREGTVEILQGAPEEVAAQLADKLIADKVI